MAALAGPVIGVLNGIFKALNFCYGYMPVGSLFSAGGGAVAVGAVGVFAMQNDDLHQEILAAAEKVCAPRGGSEVGGSTRAAPRVLWTSLQGPPQLSCLGVLCGRAVSADTGPVVARHRRSSRVPLPKAFHRLPRDRSPPKKRSKQRRRLMQARPTGRWR